MAAPLTRESVQAAHERIKPFIHQTPVLQCQALDSLASTPQNPDALRGTEYDGQQPVDPDVNLFFKCENFQKVGAFKARGAFHALSRLSNEQLSRGVITHSSGEWNRSFCDTNVVCFLSTSRSRNGFFLRTSEKRKSNQISTRR